MTGASPSAVKMRLKRGRERLKAELAPLVSEVREP
jgi:DNA-directed RNA polymerase specialized sigma24 family protein